jgi:tRNA U34 5-methylaminomethyl-2-thiouridine-forming methyltransferase MnmC
VAVQYQKLKNFISSSLKREVILTKDGSTTLFIKEWNETYHSKHGAIQEAYHVYIHNGLSLFDKHSLSILEIGFGTGLNALISMVEAQNRELTLHYTAVEAYPLTKQEIESMNFILQLKTIDSSFFEAIHDSPWEIPNAISTHFTLTKRKQFFQKIIDCDCFDLIYFDAFGYDVQPELWTKTIFEMMYKALKQNGVLVTYACRKIIKEAMINAGFSVDTLPGAPGKREMLRATKLSTIN